MWLRFTRDFDWSPRYGVTIAYKAGMVLNVTRECAEKAIVACSAVKSSDPTRKVRK